MSEDEFYQRAEAVKLDTLSDVNDIGKPWRYEEDGLTVTRTSPWSPPGCHPVGCGLQVHVKDGKVTKVDGDTLYVKFAKSGQTKKLLKDYAPIVKIGA